MNHRILIMRQKKQMRIIQLKIINSKIIKIFLNKLNIICFSHFKQYDG